MFERVEIVYLLKGIWSFAPFGWTNAGLRILTHTSFAEKTF